MAGRRKESSARSIQKPETTRRHFLQAAGAAAATASVAPLILHASDKAGSKKPVLGEGAYRYEIVSHSWGEVPSHIPWGETHGVAVDEEGLVYVTHRSHAPEPLDAVVVFDPQGKFVRSFGKEYHTGGHGIDIRKEGHEEFLYLCSTRTSLVTKTTLKGEIVWKKERLLETGKYSDSNTPYSPTNIAFSPDGGFYIGDGYGSHWIHQFDKEAKWVRTFGGAGSAPGQFQTPHGQWLDNRPGRDPSLIVADRANFRLQYLTLEGKHLGFVTQDSAGNPGLTSDVAALKSPVSFPAGFDIRGDVLLVPDLHARVTLFDKNNKVLTHLGYDPDWTKQVLGDGKFPVRSDRSLWKPGKFIHPHDACFDHVGNLFVVEWVIGGRVNFLRHVS
ncbi:MAG: twin-arginine translocation signal domain-containing protein [Planctomycetia bacterium]|nr:twin-arginine translocation signal domain-containing protein [Planctomycetia bacterium]